jgi:hypothetical protein
MQSLSGTWKSTLSGQYLVSLNEGEKSLEVRVVVEANKLVLSKDAYPLVFEK